MEYRIKERRPLPSPGNYQSNSKKSLKGWNWGKRSPEPRIKFLLRAG